MTHTNQGCTQYLLLNIRLPLSIEELFGNYNEAIIFTYLKRHKFEDQFYPAVLSLKKLKLAERIVNTLFCNQ